MLYLVEFDVWMVNEKSLGVLRFEPVHSYSKFIASMWVQMYNRSDAFSVSLRNTRDSSHIKFVYHENISLSTARYNNVIYYILYRVLQMRPFKSRSPDIAAIT